MSKRLKNGKKPGYYSFEGIIDPAKINHALLHQEMRKYEKMGCFSCDVVELYKKEEELKKKGKIVKLIPNDCPFFPKSHQGNGVSRIGTNKLLADALGVHNSDQLNEIGRPNIIYFYKRPFLNWRWPATPELDIFGQPVIVSEKATGYKNCLHHFDGKRNEYSVIRCLNKEHRTFHAFEDRGDFSLIHHVLATREHGNDTGPIMENGTVQAYYKLWKKVGKKQYVPKKDFETIAKFYEDNTDIIFIPKLF